MNRLFLITGVFLIWAIGMIIAYFKLNTSHAALISPGFTHFQGLFLYLVIITLLYVFYRRWRFSKNSEYTTYTPWHLFGVFFVQLLSVVILYNVTIPSGLGTYGNTLVSSGIVFFHILSLLVFPLFLVFLFRAIGASMLYWWQAWQQYPLRLRVPIETTLGLGIFSTGLLLLGGTGNYTFNGLLWLCGILSLASFLGWKHTYRDIRTYAIFLPSSGRPFHPYTLSAEISFLLFGFVASVSLISSLRPMPIGWDDLGVYMNFPKIMAQTGEYLLGAGTYTWQLITWTGFLFENNAAQAFFINQMGGILATITIICALSLILETPGKRQYISLPMLLGIVYYIMPMTIFQQAKDQKLDPIVMSVSVTAVLALWYGMRTFLSKEHISPRTTWYGFIALAGVCVGIAFGIKFTTLMLIISSIGFISYRLLGISGFIGWMGLFISIFTGLNLWGKLFVWMPEDTIAITTVTAMIGIIGIGVGAYQKKTLKEWILICSLFAGGIIISVLPWGVKNGIESGFPTSVSIDGLLNGSGGVFRADYSTIYTPEEIEKKHTEAAQFTLISQSGQTLNEDFSRYFWQETGLNNYLKLPFHLTIQKNQGGEFTDITFIFLALTPVILLFLRPRQGRESLWIGGIMGLLAIGATIIVHIITGLSWGLPVFPWITSLLSGILFPEGYIVLIGCVLIFAFLVEYCLDDIHPPTRDAKDMIFFTLLYGLIFWISGFGVVWYGVLIYFFMLSLIGLSALSFTTEDTEASPETKTMHILLSGSIVGFLCIYHIGGTLPHSWSNLRAWGFHEYRVHMLDQESSIFAYRSEYLLPIATLNLKDPREALKAAAEVAPSLQKIEDFVNKVPLTDFHYTLLQQYQLILSSNTLSAAEKKSQQDELDRMAHAFYSTILYPKKDQEDTGNIYRIGTFMTYLIHKNRSRYLDDSLITQFDQYFYDENPEVTIKRMQDMGIKYLLVDLNAATIDKDPRRALTTRYEHLLGTMRAKNLKLITTDNPCLQFGLDRWHTKKITSLEDYLMLVGTNYESYREYDGVTKQIPRTHKQNHCASTLISTLNAGENIVASHPLGSIITHVHSSKDAKGLQQALLPITQSWFALFEITDLPTEATKTTEDTPVSTPSESPIETPVEIPTDASGESATGTPSIYQTPTIP